MSENFSPSKATLKSLMKESFIREQRAPAPIRVLKAIDIFSFIPVPKDDPVSTKQSLIGTAVFFLIFLAYIVFDFYQFVTVNPPNAQNYYTDLDDQQHVIPRFAITYMRGSLLNETDSWDPYLNFLLSQESKDRGSQNKPSVDFSIGNYTEENQNNQQQDPIEWMDSYTKSFYNILRTSSKDLYAKGLLYSTSNASYGKIKVQMCNFTDPAQNCENQSNIQNFCAQGRIFLFIQNIYDTTAFSQQDDSNSPKFFIYNFFLEPYQYKRVTFNFQVVQTIVEPDYFFRFTSQKQIRLEIGSYIEQSSNVVPNAKAISTVSLDMLGIQFQLAPQILNVRVTYRTLIDHISMWGAFWGVLFAVFALFFLTYNRKKFYKKNPEWDRFKKNNLIINQDVDEK